MGKLNYMFFSFLLEDFAQVNNLALEFLENKEIGINYYLSKNP